MNDQLKWDIGRRIRNLRERDHYTRERLAEKAEISPQFLADIENGRKGMTVKTLKGIAETLRVSTDYIIYGTDRPDKVLKTDTELALLFEKLTPVERRTALNILQLYTDALDYAKKENKNL